MAATDVKYGKHYYETLDISLPHDKDEEEKTKENKEHASRSYISMAIEAIPDLAHLVVCLLRSTYHLLTPPFDVPFHNCSLFSDHPFQVEDKDLSKHETILFVHGGGWVAVDSCISMMMAMPFVNEGFALFSINYPLAPENPWPLPLISTLRSLAWIRKHHNVKKVSVVGESAGSSLISVAAALVCNPEALKVLDEFIKSDYNIEENMTEWEFPEITTVTCWCPIMDRKQWRFNGPLWFGLHWVMNCYTGENPLGRLWKSTQNRNKTKTITNKSKEDQYRTKHKFVTLTDLLEETEAFRITNYPPLLLGVGDSDPLGLYHSNIHLKSLMEKKSMKVKLLVYENFGHGFLRPPIVNPWWKGAGQQCTEASVEWIRKYSTS